MSPTEPASTTQPFFKLSLAQWSLNRAILRDKTLDALDFAKTARELGFDAVEYVDRIYELGRPNNGAALQRLVTELKSRSNDNGVSNLIFMVDRGGELAGLTKNLRDEAIALHIPWADAAAELGCHSIRVMLAGKGADTNYAIWKDTAADGLSRLADYAAKSQLNVIVENHGGLSSNAAKLIELLHSINRPNVGTLPDFGNFCIRREGGLMWPSPCVEMYDIYKGTEEMMPLARGVSAKSFNFDAAGNETLFDYRLLVGIIKRSGYTGHIGIEYNGPILSEKEGIKATRALLLKVAAGV